MVPPRKVPSDEKEAAKLQRRREQYKRNYEKKKVDILKKNRDSFERNSEKWKGRKAEKAKEVLNEIKVRKNEYVAVVPEITPTLEALAGHFAGDGCCLSDSRCLGVFSLDRDTVMSYEGFFGGSTKKQGKGYYWRTNAASFVSACERLAPLALTKSNQLYEAIKTDRSNLVIKEMKSNDYVYAEGAARMDDEMWWKFLAGFFTADGHCTSRGSGARAYVVFGQHHPSILHLIASRCPGGSEVKMYNPTANGSRVSQNGEKYTAYQLTFSGEPALRLLEGILPWVMAERVKKSVQRAIDLHQTK